MPVELNLTESKRMTQEDIFLPLWVFLLVLDLYFVVCLPLIWWASNSSSNLKYAWMWTTIGLTIIVLITAVRVMTLPGYRFGRRVS